MQAPHPELSRTSPDLVVYVPHRTDQHDLDNEHFLVFPAPKSDDLIAIWTQGDAEGSLYQHIALARSSDGGITWTEPITLAGPDGDDGLIASWAFPVVSRTGRIYCFYNKFTGVIDCHRAMTGLMMSLYSDDDGHTWQDGGEIPIPRGPLEHPDPAIPCNWIVWQNPVRDSKGRWLASMTRHMSTAIRPQPMGPWQGFSQCEFIRFDNLDEGVHPQDLVLTWLPEGGNGVRVQHPDRDDVELSLCEEPSLVLLPDKRLFCTMRTMTGYVYYSVSEDDGATWRTPEPLRYEDGGEKVKQPIVCCPVYALADGRYILVYHNNDGTAGGGKGPGDSNFNRRPAYIAVGEYRPDAHQPIWFGQPIFFCDSDGVAIGPAKNGDTLFEMPFRVEVVTYTSFTEQHGRRILWYPDRKYFLLGRYLTDAWLAQSRPKKA